MNLQKVPVHQTSTVKIQCGHCHRLIDQTQIYANMEVPWDFWCDDCAYDVTVGGEEVVHSTAAI